MSRKIAMALLVVSMMSLTGCNSSTEEILKHPLVDTLSKKEVNDYYKKSLTVKDIKVHNKVENEKVETRAISEEEKADVIAEVSRIEALLSKDTYTDDAVLNRQTYEYMKIQMDDRAYSRTDIINAGGIRDKYIIDVRYKGKPKSTGSLKADAKYLGVHGAFRLDKDLIPYKDEVYINRINKELVKQQETLEKQLAEGVVTKEESNYDGTPNVKSYNNLLGASTSETSIMPNIDMVFTIAPSGGTMSGYGIIPQGNNGMNKFDIYRRDTEMTMEVRYVMTRDLETGKIKLQDMYVRHKELSGLPNIENDSIFPEFIQTEIGVIIERADRVRANADITGLANGEIYKDLRNTVYWGHMGNNVYYQPVSEVTGYIGRLDNYYLVEVTTNYNEDIKKDSAGQGVFQEVSLVLLEHELMDSSLSIVDWMTVSRQTLVEPSIDFGNNLAKRFEYLSLSGQVPESVKGDIKQMFVELYQKGADKDWNGYYGMLNTDTELLSKTRRDDIYLTVKGWLNRRGSEKEYEYIGSVTDWLSGTSNQVELLTEELIIYKGTGKAQLMTNYYLLSNFEDKWVVDELKNIEITDIEGDSEIESLKQKILSYTSQVSNSESIESEPIESEPVDGESVDSEQTDSKPVESEPVESEPVESEPIEDSNSDGTYTSLDTQQLDDTSSNDTALDSEGVADTGNLDIDTDSQAE